MKKRQRIMECCMLTAVFLLGNACARIETPKHYMVSRQTQSAIIAAASAETITDSAIVTTAAVQETTTVTTTTSAPVTVPEADDLCTPFIDDNADIDPSKPMVALTFDDGPSGNTNTVLDTLEAYGAHATFFVIGRNVDEETGAVMRRAVDMGCEIGSHTFDHIDLVKASPEQFQQTIQQADDRILEAIGRYPYFLRPPYGSFDDNMRRHVGKPLAFWSVDTKDWKTKDAAVTVDRVMKNIEDGDVVLMHDLYAETAAAVTQIVPSLVQQGYQLVTLSELTYYRGVELENGMIVFSMHPDHPNYKPAPDPDLGVS